MNDGNKFLLRKTTGDVVVDSAQEIRDWFQRGQIKASDFVFDFSAKTWSRVGELPALAEAFGPKPGPLPEKRLVYYMMPGGVPVPQGPFSTKEIAQKIQTRELCGSSWVFVDGDKEWRCLRVIKVLADLLPAVPADQPALPAEAPAPSPEPESFSLELESPSSKSAPAYERQTNPSIRIDMGEDEPSAPPAPPESAETDDFPEREDATMAISTLGLSLAESPPPAPSPARKPLTPLPGLPAAPSAPPPMAPKAAAPRPNPPAPAAVAPPRAPAAPAASPPKPPGSPPGFILGNAPPAAVAKDLDFDGLTAEIPVEPIWLVKPGTSEAVSGPFRFLEVVKFLEEGRLTKNDKISKVGTNRFVRILQQYEFNVKFTLENVVENGVEKQKILIKRRHPRVPYMTGVQIIGRAGTVTGNCINLSAGGILVEMAKGELGLGENLELKLFPGLIARTISCKALVIGKIPKIPPGFALKFEDLKNDDKEAIEYFVQEALKREL